MNAPCAPWNSEEHACLSVVELSEPYPVGLWIVEDANAAPIGGTFFASLKCSAVTAAVGELPPVRYRCHADPFSARLVFNRGALVSRHPGGEVQEVHLIPPGEGVSWGQPRWQPSLHACSRWQVCPSWIWRRIVSFSARHCRNVMAAVTNLMPI